MNPLPRNVKDLREKALATVKAMSRYIKPNDVQETADTLGLKLDTVKQIRKGVFFHQEAIQMLLERAKENKLVEDEFERMLTEFEPPAATPDDSKPQKPKRQDRERRSAGKSA